MTAAAPASIDRAKWPYRMKDLCDLTGMPRQAIHFYIQQGLVPEGHKTGRNMAYYSDEHVERIRLVRKLQEERFLPLKAIRAILRGEDDHFTPAQRTLLLEVKQRLAGTIAPEDRREMVDAAEVVARAGITRRDLEQMVEVGLFGATTDRRGRTRIARDDAWMLELLGELRRAGLTDDIGFEARDLAVFEEAIAGLLERETEMLAERLSGMPPDRVAEIVTRALPLIGTFLARYHETKVRQFFAAL